MLLEIALTLVPWVSIILKFVSNVSFNEIIKFVGRLTICPLESIVLVVESCALIVAIVIKQEKSEYLLEESSIPS